MQIQMVDLHGQYLKIKDEIDEAIQSVVDSCDFINGRPVSVFAADLVQYTGAKYVIPVANGTDALQISLMALGLQPGDEVIVPTFTYVASAEVIALLHLVPVMADVDIDSFNITAQNIEQAITDRTRAIIPVHLFGQSCPMEEILRLAEKHHLYVVEDNAQSIGATYTFSDGSLKQTGTMGYLGCNSFFPSKNLGCMGDGGAIITNDKELAMRVKMIVSHGQSEKYHHNIIGCNSRLDTLQAAILSVKLCHLDEYITARQTAAYHYSVGLSGLANIIIPAQMPYSTHVYHQYTLRVLHDKRNGLKEFLAANGIPSMIYYPLALHRQKAFAGIVGKAEELINAELLSQQVLSLPMHTELDEESLNYIINKIKEYAER